MKALNIIKIIILFLFYLSLIYIYLDKLLLISTVMTIDTIKAVLKKLQTKQIKLIF